MHTDPVTYVPVLKGKEGEFGALQQLAEPAKDHVLPLIEVPPVPFDYVREKPARTLEAHVSGVAGRLAECWNGRELLLDFPWFGEEETFQDDRLAAQAVFGDCREVGVLAVPVLRRTSSPRYLTEALGRAYDCETGVCVRLKIDDFADEIDLRSELKRLGGDLPRNSIDLIVDLETLSAGAGESVERDKLLARFLIQSTPHIEEWRRVILSAASFPEDLSDIESAQTTELVRHEWQLWRDLELHRKRAGRVDMIFGDYGIAHPVPRELDPRTMRMSASIRYTTDQGWLVLKGRNVRQYGFEQYHDLCAELVQKPLFKGRGFSWGDDYITNCALRETGPGNATTWRKVGNNHHITLVAGQTAKLADSLD